MFILTTTEESRLPDVTQHLTMVLTVICILLAIRLLAGLSIVDSIINISIGAVVLLLGLFYIAKFLL